MLSCSNFRSGVGHQAVDSLRCFFTTVAIACLCGSGSFVPCHAAQQTAQSAIRPVLTPQISSIGLIRTAAYSPDNRLIVTAGYGPTIKIWIADTGELVRSITDAAPFNSAAFSPDGQQIVAGSWDEVKIWDVATGRLVRQFAGHPHGTMSAQFSRDGSRILTAGHDATAKLWEAKTGQLLRTFVGHSSAIGAASFSPDESRVVTASDDKTTIVWDTNTGEKLFVLSGHTGRVNSAAFSVNGERIVTASDDGKAKVWDAATGHLLFTLIGHGDTVYSAVFSPDGSAIVTGSRDRTLKEWDASNGKLLRTITAENDVNSVAFSRNGQKIVGSVWTSGATIWSTKTGDLVSTLSGHSNYHGTAVFSPDGRQIVTSSVDSTGEIWDIAAGRIKRILAKDASGAISASVSPDGKRIIAAGPRNSGDHTAKIWDSETGQLLRTIQGHRDMVNTGLFSPDGRRIVTASDDMTAKVWDAKTIKLICTLGGSRNYIDSAAFSPNGQRIVTANRDNVAKIWDASTGQLLHTLTGHKYPVWTAAFSPKGLTVVTASGDGTAKVWDADTGQLLHTLTGHLYGVWAASYSPDGRTIVTASADKTAKIWDAATGELLRTLTGHTEEVRDAAFSPDGRTIITTSVDEMTKLWNAATGDELCSLMSFDDDTWAVIDSEGRYDASNGGDIPGLRWVIGTDVIALSQLRDRYYEPNLLAKVMGFDKSPLRDVQAFDHVNLYPDVTTTAAPGGTPNTMTIHLTDRGGGIGRTQVYVNGVLFTDDARPAGSDPVAKSLDFTFDLSAAPTLRPGGLAANEVKVIAYNGENWLPSRAKGLDFTAAANAAVPPPTGPGKRRLFAIVAGTSEYALPALHLTYPARDAVAFANAVRTGASDDPLIEQPDITLLASGEGTPAGTLLPTKANLQAAFAHIVAEKPTPDDILIVYLSGHGVAIPLNDSTYCYLTQNANSADIATFANDATLRAATTVTSGELAEWMGKIGATYRVVILDTCSAGSAGKEFMTKRAMPGDQIRAMKRFQATEGCHVLMGCAADKVSYEASQYGQGLLTYALLQGMKGPALRENSWVDVRSLFAYAEETVPKLAGDIGGIQQPTYQKPDAGSFDIGKLTEADRSGIHLAAARPQLLRPHFGNKADGVDNLDLETLLGARLKDTDALAVRGAGAGRMAPFVYVDAEQLTGAIKPVGQYAETGDAVTVTITLLKDKARVGTVNVTGSKATDAEREALAGKIAAEIEKALPH